MFDFAELAVRTERRDEPTLEGPPVSGLRIPLGKLGSERSDWAAQRLSGQVTHRSTPPSSPLPCNVIPTTYWARRRWPSSSLSIGDCDVTVTWRYRLGEIYRGLRPLTDVEVRHTST